MTSTTTKRLLKSDTDRHPMEDYQRCDPRWCTGCGNNAILTAMQRLCRDERLPREKTVFVSGIGCSSRFPHYMNTYGFHSLHGRALPVAEGIKMRRPDLHVFVNTGDGDCCSIGTAHWIHAVRYNMDMTVLLHDNSIYGLTKMQTSPTSPTGLISNTSPRGTQLQPLNPLCITLGVANASFVAQAVDWIPDLLYQTISQAFHHKGLSFVRILQRCPEFVPEMYEKSVNDPSRTLLLSHENGLQIGPELSKIYQNQEKHDPSDIDRAREIAAMTDRIPIGILYQNKAAPRHEAVEDPDKLGTPEMIKTALNEEFDKFTVWPVTE